MSEYDLNNMRLILSDPAKIEENAFGVAQTLCDIANGHDNAEEVQELILRALEYRDVFGASAEVIDGLVRHVGLFPYLHEDSLSLRDRIAYEVHRPPHMPDDIVFHRPQAEVFRLLMAGENVALSAPTSFGKSLIIDACVASGRYKNIVIVVPTIALIDETRRRLTERFRGQYKVVTHSTQAKGERNIFVLTQERVLQFEPLEDIDFFVIDEFYKLSPEREEDGRSSLLNQAFYRLHKAAPQFYMLGPSIREIAAGFRKRFRCHFIVEPYHTVVSQLHPVPSADDDELNRLCTLCSQLTDPTIVFCRSPARAGAVALRLASNGREAAPELRSAVDWVSEHYHSEWHFAKALANGIGVHHGRIPRALGQYVVRKFNEGVLDLLVCTSTLIEGVNTKAKNMIILDREINRAEIDTFTFNNIRGRSGRMFEHFVGNVYMFHAPPQDTLPFVDIPVFTQPESARESLLIQIDDEDLTDKSRERMKRYAEQDVLSYETLKANHGVDLDQQLACAKEISANLEYYHRHMVWTWMPKYPELKTLCELIWDHFGGAKLGSGSVSSASHLTYLINSLRNTPTTLDLIRGQRMRKSDSIDDVVQRVLDFQRLWAMFHLPRLTRVVDAIQRDVFNRQGLSTGDFEQFATAVENLFLDPGLIALDEYGVPLDLSRKLASVLGSGDDMDATIARLAALNSKDWKLSEFEIDVIEDAKRYI